MNSNCIQVVKILLTTVSVPHCTEQNLYVAILILLKITTCWLFCVVVDVCRQSLLDKWRQQVKGTSSPRGSGDSLAQKWKSYWSGRSSSSSLLHDESESLVRAWIKGLAYHSFCMYFTFCGIDHTIETATSVSNSSQAGITSPLKFSSLKISLGGFCLVRIEHKHFECRHCDYILFYIAVCMNIFPYGKAFL